ncbi:MAG: adenine phosphoribosyltransferase [Methanosarcinaceae archaeon]|nr:adenine phosphoribosyltransferase [Methanosarcinaceae archaeon]
MLEKLKQSLTSSLIINKGEYNYFINPISDGFPHISPDILKEIGAYIIENADMEVDRIVTVESMGIPIATALSIMTDIPMTIIRKRSYGLPGEAVVEQTTGYSHGKLYINGLEKGQKILFVDDVISTGGTLFPLLNELKAMEIEVKGVCCVLGRGNGAEIVEKETGIEVLVIIPIDVTKDGVVIECDYS